MMMLGWKGIRTRDWVAISGTVLPDDVLLQFPVEPERLRDWLDATEVMERIFLCPGKLRYSQELFLWARVGR